MHYLFIFLLLFGLELFYFKMADRFHIVDTPNLRSSHSSLTVRGGGILFPMALIIAFLMGSVSWAITLAVVLVAVVSFIDDIRPLLPLPRFSSHFIAAGLIYYDLDLFLAQPVVLPLFFVLMIGWVNAFNFMDGINGITVLYSLTALISFAFLPFHAASVPVLITMGLSCVVFGFFNIRTKARTFAGDVGSISMALFLGYFMVKTILESRQLGYILFFSLYGIDAIITIVARLRKRENIFKAHRSHLYQYLANEWGYSHVAVSVLYAVVQLVINGIVIYLDRQGSLSIAVSLLILSGLTLVYLGIRARVIRQSFTKTA
jgi:UDP-N-acetylmuramyl pentapeptide phosphotransferase/UDP-N-acetylglucosamine-1-phosphate transferase